MGKRATKTFTSPPHQLAFSREDSGLLGALAHVEGFLAILEMRADRAQVQAYHGVRGKRAQARLLAQVEEARADVDAARRLRDQIAAVVQIAMTEVAVIEEAAATTIRAAFRQFKGARRSRAARAKTPAPKPRRATVAKISMQDLGEMAAKAKEATAYAIIDRERLARWEAELRVMATELRRAAAAPAADAAQRESLSRQLAVCEEHAAYLHAQLVAQTTAVVELKAALRKLFEKLPDAAAKAAAAPRPRKLSRHDYN